jgi:hypothetical protein
VVLCGELKGLAMSPNHDAELQAAILGLSRSPLEEVAELRRRLMFWRVFAAGMGIVVLVLVMVGG